MLYTQDQLHSAAFASSHPTLLHVAACRRCRVATNPSPERASPQAVCGLYEVVMGLCWDFTRLLQRGRNKRIVGTQD
eukprot:1146797-Pelagomonas_calceolata.AAC.2